MNLITRNITNTFSDIFKTIHDIRVYKIDEITNKVSILLNSYENLKKENEKLAKKIQSLEQEIEFSKGKLENKSIVNKNIEKEKIEEELATYIKEIDDLIKILS